MSVQISNRFRCIVIVDFFSIHPEKQAVKKIIDRKLSTETVLPFPLEKREGRRHY